MTRTLKAIALALVIPASLSAQYFGRNKVQYQAFPFSILSTAHFSIYHYPRGADAVRGAAAMLEDWYARHKEVFGFDIQGTQKVILYDSFQGFQQSNAVPGLISQGEGGVTESLQDRMVLYLNGIASEDSHVLGHELVHAFQFEFLSSAQAAAAGGPQALPQWMTEGMAEYLSKADGDPLTEMWMRDAVLNGDVPDFRALALFPDKYFPYRFGESVWAYIGDLWGYERVRAFFKDVSLNGLKEGTRSSLFLRSADDLSDRWKSYVKEHYGSQAAGRDAPDTVGRKLPGIGSGLNLSPVISPDGKYIALFSRKDLFTLDLFLADSSTGRILARLGSSETNAHFDALQFIDSVGAWSPDSRSFAFIVYRGGRTAMAVAAVPDGSIQRVVPFTELDSVSDLAWSPDGASIALSAVVNAVRDIWLLSLSQERLTRLTEGWHAEIQPAWSPDGSTLAFATDVGGLTVPASLQFKSMNIGLLDLSSGKETIISVKDGAKHICPQFSPDGKSLFFVADPDGVSDLYRYSRDEGAFYRVTRVATGVSGLTELSPCLSLSADTGELSFTVFTKRSYEVHMLPISEAGGKPVSFDAAIPSPETPEAAAAPGDSAGPAAALSASPGLSPYRTRFALTSVSQASVGLSVNPYGAGLGGAVDLLFEDTLGNHLIDTFAQINGTLDSIGGQVLYLNRTLRTNWGLSLSHIPQDNVYLLPASQLTFAGADTGIVDQKIFIEEADILGQLPLNLIQRFEADAGYTFVWFQQNAPVYYYQGGVLLGQQQLSVSAQAPLSLVYASLAFVGDDSYFGFTSPVRGWRYRFSLEQTAGSLLYLTGLADARAYLFLNPFTLAFRGLHAGRYLGDADNALLGRYYLGIPDLVRGYSYSSILANECAGDPTCPELLRLFGSKLLVFNAELRIPVLGNDQLGLLRFPYLPLTLAGFFDTGVIWTNSEPPVWQISAAGTGRIPVFSVGASVSVNLLDLVVLQIYWAYPFQRPELAGGEWGFFIEAGY